MLTQTDTPRSESETYHIGEPRNKRARGIQRHTGVPDNRTFFIHVPDRRRRTELEGEVVPVSEQARDFVPRHLRGV